MRTYTIKELLIRVKDLPSYKKLPSGYWILGIQSLEENYNEFDDVFFLFKGTQLLLTTTGTTNAGLTGLQSYKTRIDLGNTFIKTEEWYYQLWNTNNKRKGVLFNLEQISPIKYFKSKDLTRNTNEFGEIFFGVVNCNFNSVSYTARTNFITRLLGGWSLTCQVANNIENYNKFLELVKDQTLVTYCLIKEF